MFRFTIRDVLWLTVVVGVCAGWHVSNSRWSHRLTLSENQAIVNMHLFQGMAREVESAKLEGRAAQVVGLPDIEDLRRQVQLQWETEQAARALLNNTSDNQNP